MACLALKFGAVVALLSSLAGCSAPEQDANRVAAEWVLESGGQVQIAFAGNEVDVRDASDLPAEAFLVRAIAWETYPGDRNPHVTDADLPRIAELTDLRVLDLWATDVTDYGLAHLARLRSLERLQLNETRVTDRGLEHLRGLGNLKQLGLIGTAVTPEGVRRLMRDLRECRVLR
jgi:hypothetical protein